MRGVGLAGHCQAEGEEWQLSSAFCTVLRSQRNRFLLGWLLAQHLLV